MLTSRHVISNSMCVLSSGFVFFFFVGQSVLLPVCLCELLGSEGFRVSATSLINLWSLRGPLMKAASPTLSLSLSPHSSLTPHLRPYQDLLSINISQCKPLKFVAPRLYV